MSMLKRFCAVALALLFTLTCFNFPSRVAEAAGEITLFPQLIEDYVGSGDTFTVTIRTHHNIQNIDSFELYLEFNTTYFSYINNSVNPAAALNVSTIGYGERKTGSVAQGIVGLKYNVTTANPVSVNQQNALFTVDMRVLNGVAATDDVEFKVSGTITLKTTDIDDNPTTETITVGYNPAFVNIIGRFVPEIAITPAGDSFPNIGTTLNAIIENAASAPGAQFSYQWFRLDGGNKRNIAGATGTSYTTTAADVGCYVGVSVRASGGGYTGTWVDEYLDVFITKKPQTQIPGVNSIIITDVSDTFIVLRENNAYEYAVTLVSNGLDAPVGNVWKSTYVFTEKTDGIKPDTEYYLWSRYAATPDTVAGPAYRYQGANINVPGGGIDGIVRTTLTSHQIVLKTSGDSVSQPSSIYFTVEGGGPLVKDAKVNLFAIPTAGYFFDHWECTYPGITITQPTLASGAYFNMPLLDSTATITITAYFKQKATTKLFVQNSTTTTYGTAVADPFAHFNVHLLDGVGEAENPTLSYMQEHVTLYYKPFGEDVDETTTLPTNVGRYNIIAKYKGDAKNHPATHETGLYIIVQAPRAKPAPPQVGEIGSDFIKIINTDPNLMYCVYPSNSYPPSILLPIWEPGNNGELIWGGLYPATEYKVYAYWPESQNYAASDPSETKVSTLHTFKATVLENNKSCLSLYFFSDTDSTATIPAAKTVTIRNDGNGNISNITVALDDATNFEITGPLKMALEPGESTTFTIRPKADRAEAGEPDYEANIIINAKQNEPNSMQTDGTDGKPVDSVITGLTKTIPVVYEISGDPPLDISNLLDKTDAVYNGEQQGLSGATIINPPAGVDNSMLKYSYESRPVKTIYPNSETPPTDAGEYLVTVSAPAGYAGYDTAILVIQPAPLEIEGLAVTSKMYDGSTAAKLTGGTLKGIIARDVGQVGFNDPADNFKLNVTTGMPTVGLFNTPNHGTGIPVTIGNDKNAKLALTGGRADNYTLKAPAITGSIQAKPIMPIVTQPKKTYDNTYDITVQATFDTSELIAEDALSVEFRNCKTTSKDTGSWDIVMGTMVVTGNAYGNYVVGTPQLTKAIIEPKGVFVEVTGNAVVDYDGTPKSLTATYWACEGDTPNVEVTYKVGDKEYNFAQTAAGRYTIGVNILDKNYKQDGEIIGIRELVIQAGKLNYTNITRTVIPGDTSLKSTPVALFNVASSGGNTSIAGTYYIDEGSTIDSKGILDGKPVLVGNEISYRLKSTVTTDQYGDYAQVQVVFTPSSNTFETVEMYLKIVVADEGYTNTIINAPATVNIGDAIDLTSIRLRTVYDSGKATENAVVTEAMLSGYDRSNTSPSGLGMKTLVVTFPGNPLRTASFNILVLDVVEGFSVKPPDKTVYYWMMESTLDVTGGFLMPIMRTKSPADAVPLLPGMLSVYNSTLLKLGEHSVNVTYQKMTKPAAFSIRVVPPPPIDIEQPPSGSDPGVVEYPLDTVFKDGNKVVPVKNVQLVITPLATDDEARLRAAILKLPPKDASFFEMVAPNCFQMLDISLKDSTTGNTVQPDKYITIRLRYPNGTGMGTAMRVVHLPTGASTAKPYFPNPQEEGLEIDVNQFSPFAIAWLDGSNIPDPDETPTNSPTITTTTTTTTTNNAVATVTITVSANTSPTASITATTTTTPGPIASTQLSDSELKFWLAVLDMIKGAQKGSVIRVNARNYDKVPSEIMDAMTKTTDTTLVISWDGGDDVVITSKTAFTPESSREYFPMTLLSDLFGTEPPKTDDPDEGEEWLREQRAAASAATRSGSSAQAAGAGSGVAPSSADTAKFRAAVAQYLANAIDNSNGNVYDITATRDPNALMSVTPATSGWFGAPGNGESYNGLTRPQLGSPILGTPGFGSLLIIVGVMLAIAGAATALFIARNRKQEEEVEAE